MNNSIDKLGNMYNQSTRWGVYSIRGVLPTMTAAMGMGGGHIVMILDIQKVEEKNENILSQDTTQ